MEGNPKSMARKQRQKNLKYKRKPPDTKSESASPSPVADVSEPLPQRANRRQPNDAVTPTPNNVTNSTTASAENNDATGKENITIDFSNLKRETEEIDKLTKKFAKRNISSNWHRYSAPERAYDEENTEEEGPADFSALIQLPSSKGGHFQLKDEQEWSSASGEQLGEYFALNLNVLGQSLACIPIYKQLSLPKHMFTEEQLKHFDDLASQASKVYNPDDFEDPNTKVLKSLTNLIQQGVDVIKEPKSEKNINTSNEFNNLDLQEMNKKLLNIELEPKKSLGLTAAVSSNESESVTVSNQKSKSSLNTIITEDEAQHSNMNLDGNNTALETQDNLSSSIRFIGNNHSKIKNTDITEGRLSPTKFEGETQRKQKVIESQTCALQTVNQIHTKDVSMNMGNSPSLEISAPQDKLTKCNVKPNVKNIVESKLNNRESPVKLEDDDDLDFLLSLKKSDRPEKMEIKASNKDSSVLPTKRTSPQTASTQQHSELDDWLDSVLQD